MDFSANCGSLQSENNAALLQPATPPPGAHAHTRTLLITYLIYELCLPTHGARAGCPELGLKPLLFQDHHRQPCLPAAPGLGFVCHPGPGGPVNTPASTHGDVRPVIQQSSQSTPGFAAGKRASGKAPRLVCLSFLVWKM